MPRVPCNNKSDCYTKGPVELQTLPKLLHYCLEGTTIIVTVVIKGFSTLNGTKPINCNTVIFIGMLPPCCFKLHFPFITCFFYLVGSLHFLVLHTGSNFSCSVLSSNSLTSKNEYMNRREIKLYSLNFWWRIGKCSASYNDTEEKKQSVNLFASITVQAKYHFLIFRQDFYDMKGHFLLLMSV